MTAFRWGFERNSSIFRQDWQTFFPRNSMVTFLVNFSHV